MDWTTTERRAPKSRINCNKKAVAAICCGHRRLPELEQPVLEELSDDKVEWDNEVDKENVEPHNVTGRKILVLDGPSLLILSLLIWAP